MCLWKVKQGRSVIKDISNNKKTPHSLTLLWCYLWFLLSSAKLCREVVSSLTSHGTWWLLFWCFSEWEMNKTADVWFNFFFFSWANLHQSTIFPFCSILRQTLVSPTFFFSQTSTLYGSVEGFISSHPYNYELEDVWNSPKKSILNSMLRITRNRVWKVWICHKDSNLDLSQHWLEAIDIALYYGHTLFPDLAPAHRKFQTCDLILEI